MKHDDTPKERHKMDGQQQTIYPRKNWSSFIIFNCSHPSTKKLTLETVNSESGAYLHQFKWTTPFNVGSLPVHFNYLVEEYDTKPSLDIRAYHFTLGGPWLKECKNTKYGDLWTQEYDRHRPR